MRYWVGVASREHVLLGVAGGFCQVCHGKQAPLARMKRGDWILYYSPKTGMTLVKKFRLLPPWGRLWTTESTSSAWPKILSRSGVTLCFRMRRIRVRLR